MESGKEGRGKERGRLKDRRREARRTHGTRGGGAPTRGTKKGELRNRQDTLVKEQGKRNLARDREREWARDNAHAASR